MSKDADPVKLSRNDFIECYFSFCMLRVNNKISTVATPSSKLQHMSFLKYYC